VHDPVKPVDLYGVGDAADDVVPRAAQDRGAPGLDGGDQGIVRRLFDRADDDVALILDEAAARDSIQQVVQHRPPNHLLEMLLRS